MAHHHGALNLSASVRAQRAIGIEEHRVTDYRFAGHCHKDLTHADELSGAAIWQGFGLHGVSVWVNHDACESTIAPCLDRRVSHIGMSKGPAEDVVSLVRRIEYSRQSPCRTVMADRSRQAGD